MRYFLFLKGGLLLAVAASTGIFAAPVGDLERRCLSSESSDDSDESSSFFPIHQVSDTNRAHVEGHGTVDFYSSGGDSDQLQSEHLYKRAAGDHSATTAKPEAKRRSTLPASKTHDVEPQRRNTVHRIDYHDVQHPPGHVEEDSKQTHPTVHPPPAVHQGTPGNVSPPAPGLNPQAKPFVPGTGGGNHASVPAGGPSKGPVQLHHASVPAGRPSKTLVQPETNIPSKPELTGKQLAAAKEAYRTAVNAYQEQRQIDYFVPPNRMQRDGPSGMQRPVPRLQKPSTGPPGLRQGYNGPPVNPALLSGQGPSHGGPPVPRPNFHGPPPPTVPLPGPGYGGPPGPPGLRQSYNGPPVNPAFLSGQGPSLGGPSVPGPNFRGPPPPTGPGQVYGVPPVPPLPGPPPPSHMGPPPPPQMGPPPPGHMPFTVPPVPGGARQFIPMGPPVPPLGPGYGGPPVLGRNFYGPPPSTAIPQGVPQAFPPHGPPGDTREFYSGPPPTGYPQPMPPPRFFPGQPH